MDMVCAEVDAVACVVAESVEWLGGTAATDITIVRGSSHTMWCVDVHWSYESINAIICTIHPPSIARSTRGPARRRLPRAYPVQIEARYGIGGHIGGKPNRHLHAQIASTAGLVYSLTILQIKHKEADKGYTKPVIES